MIFNEDEVDQIKTLWRRKLLGWGFEKRRLTKGNRVTDVVQFRLFRWDISIARSYEKLPITRPLL